MIPSLMSKQAPTLFIVAIWKLRVIKLPYHTCTVVLERQIYAILYLIKHHQKQALHKTLGHYWNRKTGNARPEPVGG
jgi:hypothetical protein